MRLPSQLQRKAEAEMVSVPNACRAQIVTQHENILPHAVRQTDFTLASGASQQQKQQQAFGLQGQPPPPSPADQLQLPHRFTHESCKQSSTPQLRRSDRIKQRQQRQLQLREQETDNGKTVYLPAKRILRQRI